MEKKLGNLGEDWAVTYLKGNGYTIVERNYRYRKAEIDIIALKGDFLVIVEVKTRGRGFMLPLSGIISKKKISLLVAAADHYIVANTIDKEVRFDLLTITGGNENPEIVHIENAFYHF